MGRRVLVLAMLMSSPLLLGGCDMLGLESATAVAAHREAEGKAIGGACRDAGRAIEDCYALNRKADKAAIYAGWREMNDYMRDNKMDALPPQLGTPVEVARSSSPSADATPEEAPASGAKAADGTKKADAPPDATPPTAGKPHAS
jgi:hypothetical protein